MTVQSRIVLEPSAQAIVDATSTPPFLYELEPAAARKVLDDLQAAPVDKLPVEEEWITIPADVGDARVRMIKPVGSSGTLPVIVYMHGGGWILGNAGTHDRLVRELAVGARAALLFVEYPNSPDARYPVAIEQGYATAQWVIREGATNGLDARRMAVAGESVGGNMTAALTIMAKQRGDVNFVQASIYYPVTDAAMDTASYDEFAEGYYLTRKAMEWFCYGALFRPAPAPDHAPHSKRAMALDRVEAMAALGFNRFSVAGHDRGGRVAYRMALDHPDRVERLAVLDIVPTGEVWRRADRDFARGHWHWGFLA